MVNEQEKRLTNRIVVSTDEEKWPESAFQPVKLDDGGTAFSYPQFKARFVADLWQLGETEFGGHLIFNDHASDGRGFASKQAIAAAVDNVAGELAIYGANSSLMTRELSIEFNLERHGLIPLNQPIEVKSYVKLLDEKKMIMHFELVYQGNWMARSELDFHLLKDKHGKPVAVTMRPIVTMTKGKSPTTSEVEQGEVMADKSLFTLPDMPEVGLVWGTELERLGYEKIDIHREVPGFYDTASRKYVTQKENQDIFDFQGENRRIRFQGYYREQDSAFTSVVYFSRFTLGPKTFVNGGASISAIEEGFRQFANRHYGFYPQPVEREHLVVRYRRPIPIDSVVKLVVTKSIHDDTLNAEIINDKGERLVVGRCTLKFPARPILSYRESVERLRKTVMEKAKL